MKFVQILYVVVITISLFGTAGCGSKKEVDPWTDAMVVVMWNDKACIVPHSKLLKDSPFNRFPFKFNTVEIQHGVSKKKYRVAKDAISCK